MTDCDPLRLFLHWEGLVRLATEPYVSPLPSNLQNLYMHLTNYAINKEHANFEYNQCAGDFFAGHKRSFQALLEHLHAAGTDTDKLWGQICNIVAKVVCMIQPWLAQLYRSVQISDGSNRMCFQLLGFDVLFDHTLRPFLLEVNQAPSFTCDTPLDSFVREAVVRDTLQLLGLRNGNRERHLSEMHHRFIERSKFKASSSSELFPSLST